MEQEVNKDTDKLFKKKSQKKYRDRVLALRALCFLLFFIGLGQSIFSSVAYTITLAKSFIYVAAAGGVTVIATIICLYGCFKTLKQIQVVKANKMRETPGQEAILVYFYFAFILFVVYAIFGTIALFYQDEAMAWLEEAYEDRDSWTTKYADLTLEAVSNYVSLIYMIGGLISYLMCALLGVCMYLAFYLASKFESIQSIVQMINIVFMIIGFGNLNIGFIAHRYREVSRVEEAVPGWIPDALIGIGAVIIPVAYFGFYVSYREHKKGLKLYGYLVGAIAVFGAILSVILFSGTGYISKTLKGNCYTVMPHFHENLLKNMGCISKYTMNSTSELTMDCPKSQIKNLWEDDVGVEVEYQTQNYGCLNPQCCDVMIAYIKTKYSFLLIFSVIAAIFAGIAAWGAYYMHKKVKKHPVVRYSHQNDKIILIVMFAITAGMVIASTLLMPDAPVVPPQAEPKPPIFNPTLIDSFLIDDDGWIQVQNVVVYEDRSNCGNRCIPFVYNISAYGEEGQLKLDSAFMGNARNLSAIQVTSNNTYATHGQILQFQGKVNDVNAALAHLWYKPRCPLDSSNVTVEIFAIPVWDRMLQAANPPNTTVENGTVKYAPIALLKRDVKMDVRGPHTQTFTGKVRQIVDENNTVAVGDMNVGVFSSNYPNCKYPSTTSDSNGIFKFTLPILNGSRPYTINTDFTKTGYVPGRKNLTVGGVGAANETSIGVIYVMSTEYSGLSTLNVTTYNSISNEPLGDVTLQFYKKTFAPDPNNELQVTESIYLAREVVVENGNLYINDLEPGSYVVQVTKPDFYDENINLLSLGSNRNSNISVAVTPVVPDGSVRVVLSWGSTPDDLDIHAKFQVSKTVFCNVAYSEPECGGLGLDADNNLGGDNGVETITMNSIGSSNYLFFVTHFPNKDGEEETPLTLSGAKLKVYVPQMKTALLSLKVPYESIDSSYIESKYWLGFCMSGDQGIGSIVPLNKLSRSEPAKAKVCDEIYGKSNFDAKRMRRFLNEQNEDTSFQV